MKHPIWLLNSILIVCLLLAGGLAFFATPRKPRIASFKPDADTKLPKKDVSKIDLSKIYTNDLFNTYQPPLLEVKEPTYTNTIPQPPQPKPITPPAPPKPQFLAPLQVTLKGIIVMANEKENVAIMQDNKLPKDLAKNYKVGDKIQDAQLIRILKNKIMLVRSNGQQETLYINQLDAELEQMLATRTDWSGLMQKIDTTHYDLDPVEFVTHIASLAQLIDAFNVTTAYKQGVSIGSRIGILQKNSLGLAIGLQTGDVITKINEIAATETENRFEIYQKIINADLGDIITVELLRDQQPMEIRYTLKMITPTSDRPVTSSSKTQDKTPTGQIVITKTPEEIEQEKLRLLSERKELAPTIEEIKMRHKKAMLQHGASDNQNRREFLHERSFEDKR